MLKFTKIILKKKEEIINNDKNNTRETNYNTKETRGPAGFKNHTGHITMQTVLRIKH